jgi:NTE family protein
VEFSNDNPANPITMDHLIASGSLPPSYPAKEIGDQSFWDGGLFDKPPISKRLSRGKRDDRICPQGRPRHDAAEPLLPA